jgi:hypothetical protein
MIQSDVGGVDTKRLFQVLCEDDDLSLESAFDVEKIVQGQVRRRQLIVIGR